MTDSKSVEVLQCDEVAAEDAVAAINLVSFDGYYELDIDALTLAFARHRTRTDERMRSAQGDFEAALAAMPFGADRIEKGQQFNAYESALNDEEDDPDYWEFFLSLGPITDHVQIVAIEGEWRAKLIEAALRVAMNARAALGEAS